MAEGPCVLVIDDDVQIRRYLKVSLATQGYQVIESASGGDGLATAHRHHPDVILLDLGLGDMDGLEVLRSLRGWSMVPVIVLSVRSAQEDKVAVLDAGADDYLTKPFGTQELMARLRSVRRHFQLSDKTAVFDHPPLRVDLEQRLVWSAGEPVDLSDTEYALLRYFVQHAGKLLSQSEILREIWGPDSLNKIHYLRTYITRLRRKVELDPANPTLILTEPGVGYRLGYSLLGDEPCGSV